MKAGIHHGDCRELIKDVQDGTVQIAGFDPPYNIGYGYDGEYDDNLPKERYIDWSVQWMASVKPKLKPDGSLWLIMSDEYAAELKVEAEKLGYQLRSWNIWYFTFGVFCKGKFSRSHQHMFWFGVGDNLPAFYQDQVLVPSARQARYNDKRARAAGKTPNDVWILFPDQLPAEDGMLDVWLESRIAGTFKRRDPEATNQLPEYLVGRMIAACSKPGDIVLDLFAGSGTVPVAAKKLDRIGIGFEQSKNIANRAQRRFVNAEVGEPLT